jgi:hypothetical protein
MSRHLPPIALYNAILPPIAAQLPGEIEDRKIPPFHDRTEY